MPSAPSASASTTAASSGLSTRSCKVYHNRTCWLFPHPNVHCGKLEAGALHQLGLSRGITSYVSLRLITQRNLLKQQCEAKMRNARSRRGKTVVSNATRWDTFEAMMGEEQLPPSEAAFRKRYQKSPSFLSIHMGVRAELLPEVRE